MRVKFWVRGQKMDIETKFKDSLVYETKPQMKIYFVEDVKCGGGVCYLVIKRLFDIIFSILVGILTSPIMLVISLLIKLESHGKVLYIQERVGKDGKEFNMLKFRTMIENAEKGSPVWADEDDPRCTNIGKKLRKYRLDELPQLWNIFVGHMSVVGPRPERRYFYNKFEEYIPGFSKRLKVKPGLTGLAQVNGGYYLLPEEKIIYDMQYIKTRSIWRDLKIILHTVRVVFKKEGAK